MYLVPASPRIFGLGWALAVSLLLGALLMLYVLTSSRSKTTSKRTTTQSLIFLAFIFYTAFILTVALLPRINVGEPWPADSPVVDQTWYWKLVFAALVSAACLLSTAGLSVIWAAMPVYAKV